MISLEAVGKRSANQRDMVLTEMPARWHGFFENLL